MVYCRCGNFWAFLFDLYNGRQRFKSLYNVVAFARVTIRSADEPSQTFDIIKADVFFYSVREGATFQWQPPSKFVI